MANIIFDLDDTLFDTQKLKDDIFGKLVTYNITIKNIKETYSNALDKDGNYIFQNHIKILQKMHDLEIVGEMQSWFDTLDLTLYVFSEVKEVLEKLAAKHNLILITKGSPEFQNKKIKKTKIEKYFKEIYVIEEKKEKLMKKKNWSYPLYFINDKENENKKIKEEFPEIIIIHKKNGGHSVSSAIRNIIKDH